MMVDGSAGQNGAFVKIGIDLDEVVCDFASQANRWLANHCTMQVLDVDEWNWFMQYPEYETAWDALWTHGVKEERLLLHLYPLPSANYALRRLARDHDLHFITYRPEWTRADTEAWLQQHGHGDVPLTFTQDKTTVECDVYLDDHGPTVEAMRAGGHRGVLFRQRWNREHWLTVPSVGGWADFVQAIDGWGLCAKSKLLTP